METGTRKKRYYVVFLYSVRTEETVKAALQRCSTRADLLIPTQPVKDDQGETKQVPLLYNYAFLVTAEEGAPEFFEFVSHDPVLAGMLSLLSSDPLTEIEVDWLAQLLMSGEDAVLPQPKPIVVGDLVKVTRGPFRDFTGVVQSVKTHRLCSLQLGTLEVVIPQDALEKA